MQYILNNKMQTLTLVSGLTKEQDVLCNKE